MPGGGAGRVRGRGGRATRRGAGGAEACRNAEKRREPPKLAGHRGRRSTASPSGCRTGVSLARQKLLAEQQGPLPLLLSLRAWNATRALRPISTPTTRPNRSGTRPATQFLKKEQKADGIGISGGVVRRRVRDSVRGAVPAPFDAAEHQGQPWRGDVSRRTGFAARPVRRCV